MEDTANVVATVLRHMQAVREGLYKIESELHHRGIVHDSSKLDVEGELPGFARINKIARQHPYGNKEYKEALASEQETIDDHYEVNSHHPEHHWELLKGDMGWLDIIEMVVDWYAATKCYGNTAWPVVMKRQKERFDFTDHQWWLIVQVATFLETYRELED